MKSYSVVFFACSLTLFGCAQQNKLEMFKASTFTPEKSFTNGCEGPAVDKEGNVYAVNFAREGTIGKVSPDGKPELFVELPQGSTGNGIRFDSKGDMFIADYTGHNVLKVDMKTKNVTTYAHEPTMSQPNDIAIDSKDRIYASDPNWKEKTGRFWRIDTDGKITLLDSLGTANGIEVSPDEKTLYVNAGREIWAYDLSEGGEVSNKRRVIEFPDFGVDGMRCDVKGNIYIARFGKGVVAKVSPKGYILKEVTLTGKKPTNVAFGGKDGRTVYVTLMDMGNLESFRVDEPGREWQMQKDRN
jgi:gluconolactonase